MQENNKYSKLKIIGLGVSALFVFLLILSVLKPKTTINADSGTEELANEPVLLVQNGSESFAVTAADDAASVTVSVPMYDGEPFVLLNEDTPLFTETEIQSITGVIYSDLDELGRCGPAYGLIGPETIPQASRGSIGNVKPSGWHTVRYDDLIEDRYLYNRCHLIAYQLAGANAEERNLITGTRYLNVTGMLPIENEILEYITGTGNHVLYRVTPIFEGNNLLASGVITEAYSFEDNGQAINICRYLFNVQPGVVIDYKTGESYKDNRYLSDTDTLENEITEIETDSTVITRQMPASDTTEDITYVLNTNTMRFHDPLCSSVMDMKDKNREYSTKTREELIQQGYIPCGSCNP